MSQLGLVIAPRLTPQQKRIMEALSRAGAGGMTTMDLIRECMVCDMRRLRELREMGLVHEPDYVGRSADGASVFRYRKV